MHRLILKILPLALLATILLVIVNNASTTTLAALLENSLDSLNSHSGIAVSIALLAAQIAGILTAIRAILETRTSQGAIAWTLSLLLLPTISVPAYWIFGRTKFNGYISLRRRKTTRTAPTIQAAVADMRAQNLLLSSSFDKAFAVERLAHLPLTRGNSARLLVDGNSTFNSIFDGIARARSYVLVQFYIIHDDRTGQQLQKLLIQKAREGLRCYLLYDEVGSLDLSHKYLNPLRQAGVTTAPFNTRLRGNRFQINFRNHRKIVVIDGDEAWVGGLNIGDEYRGLDKNIGHWRDTHVHLQGPSVQCVQSSFIDDWHWATDEIPVLNWHAKPAPFAENLTVLTLPSSPAETFETATLFFLNVIHNARKRIWIASPYFVPDEQFISALQLAALHGVDVRILIPDKADNFLVNLSAWSYIAALEAAGIKTYRYTRGFMHQKVFIVDDHYCGIGTANFDNRSFRLNFELTMAFSDFNFTSQVAAMLETDFAHSRRATLHEFKMRGFWFRLATKTSMLLAPIQ